MKAWIDWNEVQRIRILAGRTELWTLALTVWTAGTKGGLEMRQPSDELSDLSLRVAEITREQRQRRDREREDHRTASHVTNGTLEAELEQIDFIDSCTGDDDEEDGRSRKGAEPVSLTSQFMAYIERRISTEGSPVKTSPSRDFRTDDPRRQTSLHNRGGSDTAVTSSYAHNQRSAGAASGSGAGVERVRREAQLAALRYEEERQKTRSVQRDGVMNYVKHKSSQSPTKLSPTDSESLYPSRRSTHTDDSALFMSEFEALLIFEIDTDTNTIKKRPDPHKQQGEDYGSLSPTALQTPTYPSPAAPSPPRGPGQRPESYLFRLSQREEKKKGKNTVLHCCLPNINFDALCSESHVVMMGFILERNIECRLKVSLPSDLGAALTDGVVLCHLANHVCPRSIPSIHVPSPAVPKLTMAKCRRNVENFLEACRRIGVPQNQLCLPLHILEERGLSQVAGTVRALLDLAPPKHTPSPSTTPTSPSTASPLAL
ncbi:hypothetical protein cypCar_00037080 [Cyprinus carpio]|nr:hypothetical protein cypCar_00037080 [Cyprinus carpio]